MSETVFDQKTEFFDRWAPSYDWLLPSVFYQAVHQRLCDYVDLEAGDRVLDLGCGTGRLLKRLVTQYPTIQGVGLDLSPKMLQAAQALTYQFPQLSFQAGRSDRIPFEPNSFQAVFCTISFLHYPDPQAVFQDIQRVLSRGGQFYFVDYLPWRHCPLVPTSPKWVGGIQFYTQSEREALAKQVQLSCCGHYHLMGPVVLSKFQK